MKNDSRIIILGGGPTGLGAAWRLRELGYKNWGLYEKNDYFGGISASHVDEKDFLWDEGGHVLFSHYKYFDEFIRKVLGGNFFEHQRESWIRMSDAWVPYPFQNNIRYLKPADQLRCLVGLFKASEKSGKEKPRNFKEWILSAFGEGVGSLFMMPNNLKNWAVPLEKMSYRWIADRISVVDAKKILENIIFQKDDISWGPNNVFKFPKLGGTGEIYKRAAEIIGEEHLGLNKQALKIDSGQKKVVFSDGSFDSYDYIINTTPLDLFVRNIQGAPVNLKKMASRLFANQMLIVGLGIEKEIKTSKCWVYFPEDLAPFFRLTFFHNYSPNHVPAGNIKKYSAFMCDISYSKFKKVDKSRVVDDCVDALVKFGILEKGDRNKIVSKKIYNIPYGYPVPTLDRDKILKRIQIFLMKNNIYSRGRFGAWKYEIGNMDHSFMQGVEAVDKILKNKKETIWSL